MKRQLIKLASGVVVLLVASGCGELPTQGADAIPPNLKPGSAGPSYATLSIPVAAGWSGYGAADINAAHQTVGVMNPAGYPSQLDQRAAYWVAGGAAAPVPLPMLPGVTRSVANTISDNGIIGGRIWPAAVLWHPNGSGWDIQVLAENGEVSGVRDDGVAVGTMWDPVDFFIPPQPVVWDAAGVPDTLPLPPGGPWTGGTALAINDQGDVAGTVQIWTLGSSTIYGALWTRAPAGWTPHVFQFGHSRGLSNRTGGQIYVTASDVHDAYRHRLVQNGTGQWTSDSVYVQGVANGMNVAGDFVGALEKGRFGGSPKPFVYPATGAVLNLPLPKNANGIAVGISDDGWITGSIDGVGVVWKPGS